MEKKIRVLIIDDSALMREALRAILTSDEKVEVVGLAKNGQEGLEKAKILKPDVITIDINMPVMNGLEATQLIMSEVPTSIIVVSGMDPKVVVKALAIGAMDFVVVSDNIEEISASLIEKVTIASRVRPMRLMRQAAVSAKVLELKKTVSFQGERRVDDKALSRVVAIGISTGGPQALHVLLSQLPKDFPAGILIVQHMSAGFIQGLAEWLQQICPLTIKVPGSGDVLRNGYVYLAPDNVHMTITPEGVIELREETEKKVFLVPSADVLFKSVAESYGTRAIGLLMTGMGHDGVEGMKQIKRCGGQALAQDEASSVVFGMNKSAIDCQCVDKVLALEKIGQELINLVSA